MLLETLEDALAPLSGNTIVSLDTLTALPLLGGKANPFKGKVAKYAKGHRVMLFQNKNDNAYLAKVRRHLEAEGKDPNSFQLSERKWGRRLPNLPIVEHEGFHYLECIFLTPAPVITYHAMEEIQRHDVSNLLVTYPKGSEIPKEEIIGINPNTGSEHQGLDKKVIVRTYALENILGLRAFKQAFQ